MNRLDKDDIRRAIFKRDRWTCQNCRKSVYACGTPQLAHRIADTKLNRKKYGNEIIDHLLNRWATCCLYCNGKMNIGFNRVESEKLADKILAQMEIDK